MLIVAIVFFIVFTYYLWRIATHLRRAALAVCWSPSGTSLARRKQSKIRPEVRPCLPQP